MTPDEKCFLFNRENLQELIQMILSKKMNIFSQYATAFLKTTFNFKHFETKDQSYTLPFFEIIDCERGAYVNV